MKIFKVFCGIFLLISFSFSYRDSDKISSGKELLSAMYKRYHGNWYKDFTFTQKTENYRNDSLIRTGIWHEFIVFPDHFRINFGDSSSGNAMIQRGDSTFDFRKFTLIRKGPKREDLVFILGGLYFIPFDSVLTKMNREGFQTNKFHKEQWQGKDAYVLGASSLSEKSNQLWIDAEKLVPVRFIKYADDRKEEAIFSDHKRYGNAWSETSCLFLCRR